MALGGASPGGRGSVCWLGDYDGSRRNNFTLLRLVFALAVLVGHSYPITDTGSDPLTRVLPPGYGWIGSIAVAGFFAVSGFLVTASFVNRGFLAYAASRALRLYPAVIVYCALAILIIGPLATEVDLKIYFLTERWDYMTNALLWVWQRNLPFVFSNHPMAGATNGSTWTLPIELRSYILVAAIGVLGIWRNRITANFAVVALLGVIGYGMDLSSLFADEERYREPMLFFVMGAGFWINRAQVPLFWPLALAGAALPWLVSQLPIHPLVYALGITYLILFLAYRLPFVHIDRFGDISYGVYIYAWPVQQLLWWPGQSGAVNALLATLIVVPIAYTSWKLVEEPALQLRRWIGFRRRAPAMRPASDG